MTSRDYLVTYGALGDFGRFYPTAPMVLPRGGRAVVRTTRGMEIGEVMREATTRHAQALAGTPVGELLRRATDEDERQAERMRERGFAFCDEAGRLGKELGLPILVLDAEILFDGEHAALHYVRQHDCDIHPLVSHLSRQFELSILVQDLTRESVVEAEEEHGCGSCGEGEGGCGSGGCGSGGCNTCGSVKAEDVQSYFVSLREKMIARNRVALL